MSAVLRGDAMNMIIMVSSVGNISNDRRTFDLFLFSHHHTPVGISGLHTPLRTPLCFITICFDTVKIIVNYMDGVRFTSTTLPPSSSSSHRPAISKAPTARGLFPTQI